MTGIPPISDDELVSWFTSQNLPEIPIVISRFESTENLKQMVDLQIKNLRAGDPNARKTLERIKKKLEWPF